MQLKCSARSQKSALSSSCYRAHFWGALISNIAHEGRVLIRGNMVVLQKLDPLSKHVSKAAQNDEANPTNPWQQLLYK